MRRRGDTPRWFQLYWPPNRELAASFLDRAEGAGYEAIIRTVDTPITGWWSRDLQNSCLPFPNGDGVANYFLDPVVRNLFDVDPEEHTLTATKKILDVFGDASLTWTDLDRLRDQTDLPVLVKSK